MNTETTLPDRLIESPEPLKAVRGPAVESERSILGSNWLGSVFDPVLFLVCVAVAFITCSGLGYLAGEQNQFGDVQRFGITLGPQAGFFPTIRQLITFAHSRGNRSSVYVIVGGNSILNGVGQNSYQVWTRALQSKLGSHYAVVNLAMRSCSTYEGALFVAEAMKKQGDKVIFVTNTTPAVHWNPLGVNPYAHLYWDAKFHHMLYEFPERELAIRAREKTLPDGEWKPDDLNELKLSRMFNTAFNFMDLWNAIGYRYFYTMYNPITQAAPFAPLKKLPEAEVYEKFPVPQEKIALDSIKQASSALFAWDSTSLSWKKIDSFWNEFVETLHTNVAPELRSNTLVLLTHYNPSFCSRLSDSEQKRHQLAYDEAERMINQNGIRSVQSGVTMTSSDFRDTKHLSAAGGAKLALQVAKEVETMAAKLGYCK